MRILYNKNNIVKNIKFKIKKLIILFFEEKNNNIHIKILVAFLSPVNRMKRNKINRYV